MLYGNGGTDPKAIVTDGGATQADLDAGTMSLTAPRQARAVRLQRQ